ncbi:MAG: hypothetical protein LBW77_01760, partial [Verrucomicrobiota bacterium]|nr:hypothetical protein [Verrucomicrobiota bacterium]
MKLCVSRAVLACALVSACAVHAFQPPSDKQSGVTLRIEGFAEQSTHERFAAEKIQADQPLAFTVTLMNDRAETVAGKVKVWLNDDWQVTGPDTVTLSAEPGKSVSVTCSAQAKPSVLSAIYPLHARLALTLDPPSRLSFRDALRLSRHQKTKRIDGFIHRGKELVADSPDVFKEDPSRLIRVFRHCQQ